MRLFALVLLVVLAGCTESPSPSPPSPSSTGQLASLDRFRDRPCDLLTPGQWEKVGFSGEGREVVAGSCDWVVKPPARAISLSFYTSGDPMDVTCSAVKGEAVVEKAVDGRPARLCVRTAGRACTATFRTGQELNVLVITSRETDPDDCADATSVIGFIISNLGG